MQVPPAQQPVQFDELQAPLEPPPWPLPPPWPPPVPPAPHLNDELQLMLDLVQSTQVLPAVPHVVLLPLFGVFTHVPLESQQPEQFAELHLPPLLLQEGTIAARKPIAAPSARAL
jgi:hypothetical protein